MEHILDRCSLWIEEHPEVSLKDIYCEKCLQILHEMAAQKLMLAYEYLCEVKCQRYEAAFKDVEREVENKRGKEAWREAVSVDIE